MVNLGGLQGLAFTQPAFGPNGFTQFDPYGGSLGITPTYNNVLQPQQSNEQGFNLNSLRKLPNTITNGINNFGTSLGFSPFSATVPNTAIGAGFEGGIFGAGGPLKLNPAGTGVLGSGGATLSGTLGAAGLGSFAGGFLGQIGGNSTGGSVGGGVGAAIGNIVAPGIGGLIGGALGGLVGGFFGGKKPSDKTQGGTFDLSKGIVVNRPGFSGKKFSQQNYDMTTTLLDYTQQLQQIVGPQKTKVGYVLGDRDGYRLWMSDAAGKDAKEVNYGKDIKKMMDYVTDTIIERAGGPDVLGPEAMARIKALRSGQGGQQSQPQQNSYKPPMVGVLANKPKMATFSNFIERHRAGESPTTNGPGLLKSMAT